MWCWLHHWADLQPLKEVVIQTKQDDNILTQNKNESQSPLYRSGRIVRQFQQWSSTTFCRFRTRILPTSTGCVCGQCQDMDPELGGSWLRDIQQVPQNPAGESPLIKPKRIIELQVACEVGYCNDEVGYCNDDEALVWLRARIHQRWPTPSGQEGWDNI